MGSKRHIAVPAIIMVLALTVGMIFQHHHHRADGSVCICLSSDHHAADHDHHGCNSHHSSDPDSDPCEQALSDLLQKLEHRSHPLPALTLLSPAILPDAPIALRAEGSLTFIPVLNDRLPAAPIRAVGSQRAPPQV